MRGHEKTLQAGVSLCPAESVQSEPQAWKAPTLTTWEIEEETLVNGSGHEMAK
jgi:hypothetical protein